MVEDTDSRRRGTHFGCFLADELGCPCAEGLVNRYVRSTGYAQCPEEAAWEAPAAPAPHARTESARSHLLVLGR